MKSHKFYNFFDERVLVRAGKDREKEKDREPREQSGRNFRFPNFLVEKNFRHIIELKVLAENMLIAMKVVRK